MISGNPNISIDELRIALDVTDRTIARYISELKDKGIIERKGPDNGGEWKIKQVNN
jgi:ATP-dependent DNA helicase RecG